MDVEAKATLEIGTTMILPAAIRYQGELAATAASLQAIDLPFDRALLDHVSALVTELSSSLTALKAELADEGGSDLRRGAPCGRRTRARHGGRSAAPADALESVVADDLWPLPTYQEMLNIL